MTSALALWQPPPLVVRPSGIPSGDGADLLAGAWSRLGTSAQTQVDAQIARQADVALDRVMNRAPAAGVLLQEQVRLATAQVQRAATQVAHDAAADALRQAGAALLRAEPWLRQEVATLSATGGRSAADSGLATVATQLAPWALAALLVGGAIYLATVRDAR